MARGNQRDKAREKNQKESAGQQTGTEFARTKEAQAAIMRAKQEANAKKAADGPSTGGEKKK
ncbi:MAG: hypothetical protein Q9202_001710 [Teloschistes flavicans]